MKTRIIHIAVPALLLSLNAFAQSDSSNRPSFRLAVYHNSHLNYFGRTNNVKNGAVFPMAELWFNKNVYINAAPVFIYGKGSSLAYAGTVATGGVRFVSEDNKFTTNIFAVKPFYKPGVPIVQSALKAQTALSVAYSSKIVNVTAGGDLKFSSETDFGATLGIDHLIRQQLGKNAVLVVDPSAYVYMGTQRFNEKYYKEVLGMDMIPQQRERVNFGVLSYELSVPIVIGIGKVQLIAVPAYVIPQNIYRPAEHPEISESGENLFYITSGVKINF